MDAADAAGREDADSRRARDGERAADGRRADGALYGCGGEVARPGFAGVGLEAGELLRGQADADLPVEYAHSRRDSARVPHLALRLEPDLDALARGEAVRDERGLERDDGSACGERVAHLRGDVDHADRSISTKRLSSPLRAS